MRRQSADERMDGMEKGAQEKPSSGVRPERVLKREFQGRRRDLCDLPLPAAVDKPDGDEPGEKQRRRGGDRHDGRINSGERHGPAVIAKRLRDVKVGITYSQKPQIHRNCIGRHVEIENRRAEVGSKVI